MEQSLPAMNKKLIDICGQALIETFICAIAFKLFVVGFLFLSYQIALTKWVDFWSYRTLICLIESRQNHLCRQKLEEKLQLFLSPQNYRIKELWLTHKQTRIQLLIDIYPFGEKIYEKQVDLPLSAL